MERGEDLLPVGSQRGALRDPFFGDGEGVQVEAVELVALDNPEQVAALYGAAPVTLASGKSRAVAIRYSAKNPARVAITGFADNSRHSSGWAANAYKRARARDARHPPTP